MDFVTTLVFRTAVTLALVVTLASARPVPAQEPGRQELALELARLMLDATARQRLGEQVNAAVIRAIGISLEERLNRSLQETEWRALASMVERFVADTLPAKRIEEIAARSYANHFEAAELGELLRFQRSAVGQKATRLAPVIDQQTARAIDAELRESPSMPHLLAGLADTFPVLRRPESP